MFVYAINDDDDDDDDNDFFPQACVSAVKGHPRSLVLVPIESA